jgi:hypothetical protein
MPIKPYCTVRHTSDRNLLLLSKVAKLLIGLRPIYKLDIQLIPLDIRDHMCLAKRDYVVALEPDFLIDTYKGSSAMSEV